MTHRNETPPAPTKWPPEEQACYGTMCSKHCTCARYKAVEGNSNQQQVFIGTCGPERPLYIDARKHWMLVELAAKAGQA